MEWINVIEYMENMSKYRESNLLLLLVQSWKLQIFCAQFPFVTLNFIILIDMYLTMKNPFYPRSQRSGLYILLITGIMIWLALQISSDIDYEMNLSIDSFVTMEFYSIDSTIFFIIFGSITILPVFLILIRLFQ